MPLNCTAYITVAPLGTDTEDTPENPAPEGEKRGEGLDDDEWDSSG